MVVVAAVFLVPSALAQRPDDRAGPIGIGAVAIEQEEQRPVRPDDRGGRIGIGSITAPAAEVASPRPEPRADQSASAPTIVVTADAFDWRDAGVGVAGGLALAAGAVLVVVTTHRRRPQSLA
jgi:hypothetical protein